MGLCYASGFQVASGEMALSTLGTGVTITAGYYMPGDLDTNSVYNAESATYALQRYSGFAAQVKTQFDAATGTTFTVAWSQATGLYTISRATNFSLTWSTAADIALRDALGFTSSKTGTNTYTSDVTPAMVMISAIDGRTNVTGPVEPDDIAEEVVSDGGDAFVVTRKTDEYVVTWSQSMEPRAAVMALATSGGAWQKFFRACRGTHPFFCNDALGEETEGAFYRLTARGASCRPRRVTADFDDYWIVPFEARWLGAYFS